MHGAGQNKISHSQMSKVKNDTIWWMPDARFLRLAPSPGTVM